MIRTLLALALLLPACGAAAQRDAALGAVVAGAGASLACYAAASQDPHHRYEYGGCVVVSSVVGVTGGVVLHSQLQQAEPAGDRQ